VVITIAPPTRMATIGTSNPPKPMIESTNLIFPVSCSSLARRLRCAYRKVGAFLATLSGSMPRSIRDCRSCRAINILISSQKAPITTSMIGINKIQDPLKARIRMKHPTAKLPLLDFLVELTGIEPVASWLQTRRSPS
jgi:hypothetical protein